MNYSTRLLGLLALVRTTIQAYVPIARDLIPPLLGNDTLPELAKRDDDPTDFSWVKRWAAIGDSYTAGIGAGNPLGDILTDELSIELPDGKISGHGDWYCARYDQSYPMILDRLLGGQVEHFQYFACSGDRSEQIYQQAQQLEGDLDLVVMTVGGNDLCLAGIIRSCILLSSRAEAECETMIDVAQENVETIIKENVKNVLYQLAPKMNNDGIIVVNGYAQFFDTSSDNCDKQSWDFFYWLKPFRDPLKLTIERRKRFNKLVIAINEAIAEAINEFDDHNCGSYKIGFADWDKWVYQGVDGQMCSTKSNGDYPDPNQPDMQFIKPDTHPWSTWQDDVNDELRKRGQPNENELAVLENVRKRHEESIREDQLYRSALFRSANPKAAAMLRLKKRDPEAPYCPGDDKWDYTMGLGLPNEIGANFHPNENGHRTIASYTLAEIMDLRSLVLEQEAPSCEVKDQFKCWSADGSKAYAMADRLDANYNDFCDSVDQPDHTVGWSFEKSYHEGTPEEHSFLFKLSDDSGDFDKDECVDSMKKLIHNCDTNNAMNWKFGGQYVRGEATYEINIKRDNRPWPPPEEAYGSCKGWYKFLFSSYTLYGAGFSTWDWGQKTLLDSMTGCYGHGTTAWKFEYFDEPDEDGNEWKATFNTPIWVRSRCFKNNKVVKGAGGYTNGCGGND